ncbi:MAG: 3-isopropylmalate dehydrogenase [Bacteroidota bacterium]
MKKNVAILAGDGIGPEVVREARKVLDAIGQRFDHQFAYQEALIGAAAIDATGDPFPTETHQICLEADAILFGAIGDPKYDNDPSATVRPEQGLLAMRKALGLFANIRPVKAYDVLLDASPLKTEIIKGVDFVILRELIGGIYFGKPRGRNEKGDEAFDSCVYDKAGILRITEQAFTYAYQRRKKVTLVDKANVLATSRLWREVVTAYAAQHPEIEFDCMFVDNAAMQLIRNPGYFDVVLTENMFGDILSDEASVITGSMGTLPSASVGEKTSLYEPIHGSYPQVAGQNRANPLATILSAAMMLEYEFGMTEEGKVIRQAVEQSLEAGFTTEDIRSGIRSTSEVGDYIARQVLEQRLTVG